MRILVALALLVAACEPIPTRGTAPPITPPPPPPPAPVEVSTPEPEPEPVAEIPADAPTEALSDEDLLAAAMGLPITPKPKADDDLPLPVAPDGLPAVPARAPWTPADAAPPAWGVRLVGTLPHASPPRAVLGLSSGAELVVEAGDMVPEEQLIVLAVGADAVQVAHVRPDGDRAEVRAEVLTPLYQRDAPAR